MKQLFFVLILLSVGALAQVAAVPAGSPVVQVAASEVSFLQWVVLHQGLIAGAVVGILDLVMALIPGLASNGILHSVYLFIKNVAAKKEEPKAS